MTNPTETSLKRTGLELLLASFATLLLELALIRWLPERVRVIAYFPNLVLIAAFLGLGVGALSRRNTAGWLGVALFILAATGAALGRIAFTASGTSEHLWLLYYDLPKDAPVVNSVVIPIAFIFLLTAALFIPLGGVISHRIQRFKTFSRPLDGYAIDLLGSLAGVAGFILLAALGTHPVWWFTCVLLAVGGVMLDRGKSKLLYVATGCCALVLIHFSDHAQIYSPYYAITTIPQEHGIVVMTNGSLHQQGLDLRAQSTEPSTENFEMLRSGYWTPVRSLKTLPKRALVLGAGSGNDVTVLLDAGVPEVHAVEIDPAIIEIGRTLHPAHPYQDPRVIIHNTDARAFLEQTALKFDLIVFGTLDSMTRLSALSNVRLDNFVYTVESVQAARAKLTENGGLALMFMSGSNDISDHLFNIFWHAFGEPPARLHRQFILFNEIFFGGPGYAHLKLDPRFNDQRLSSVGPREIVPNDDWPFLYLPRPGIPSFYFGIVALVLGTAALLLFGTSRSLRASVLAGEIDVEMMLLGAAFLLCETGFVTQMNLLFGATWRTSAIIFASILVALIASTLLARGRAINARLALACAIVALVVISALPLRSLAPADPGLRIIFALFLCGIPLTFSGLAFAARFAVRPAADAAFGWNVLGAVIGGLLEMSSMLLGLRAVFLGAALLYAAAILVGQRYQPKKTSAVALAQP